MDLQASDVVDFWRNAGPSHWFARDEAFDMECARRFLDAHHCAARREFEHWMGSAPGALALLILLDQIRRNVFRGSAHAYATDGLARHYARRALQTGFDAQTQLALQSFFYMPFEHSEDLVDQERSLALHRALPGENPDRWAKLHIDVIHRFGRFPHRNAALGRDTTPQEQAFLDGGGFSA